MQAIPVGSAVLERPHVVVWGAERTQAGDLAERLGLVGCIAHVADSAEGALNLLSGSRIDAIVVDGRNSDSLLRDAASRAPEVALLVIVDRTELERNPLLGGGAQALLARPFHDKELLQAVVQARALSALRRELSSLRSRVAASVEPSLSDMARQGGLDIGSAEQVQRESSPDGSAFPILRDARDAFERAYLQTVLRRARGNVTVASRVAGRNRTDFYELLRRRRVTPSDFKK